MHATTSNERSTFFKSTIAKLRLESRRMKEEINPWVLL
jgi:hypothetical protein